MIYHLFEANYIVSIGYQQDFKLTELRYKVVTFNIILGLVGGLAGVIMSTLTLLFGWYPAFLFERSLVRKLFTESETQQTNPTDITDRVQKYRPFVYMLKDYLIMKLLNLVTCCQCMPCCRCVCVTKRRERYDRF
jgi:hypothetical protein